MAPDIYQGNRIKIHLSLLVNLNAISTYIKIHLLLRC
jgi:hypothetical protein